MKSKIVMMALSCAIMQILYGYWLNIPLVLANNA